jgi:parallel beta-helix repeat protein
VVEMGRSIWENLISSYIIIILVAIGFMSFSFFNIISEKNETTSTKIIVDWNGNGNYTTIQEAINNASSGDTIYVWAGIYNENIIINKTITLIGNDTTNTRINGSGFGDVVSITSDWVNISGFTIVNSGNKGAPNYDSGIKLDNVENVTIDDNYFFYNRYGIFLNYSDLNIIKNNLCSSKSFQEWDGILLYYSHLNIIKKNDCHSNSYNGIKLEYSTNNTIENNNCNSNDHYSIFLEYSSNNTIANNTCNSNINSGLWLWESTYNTIKNNTCNSNSGDGMEIFYSSNNRIEKNRCSSNSAWGIFLGSSSYNKIINNTCSANTQDSIRLGYSSNNSIMNNTCLNNYNGLHLYVSNYNIFTNNNFSNNRHGIYFEDNADNNDIHENIISSNSNFGLSIDGSCDNNHIFHNIIISNSQQANYNGYNIWNNNLQEGNYWSDYTGLDNGADGRIKGDGIGDTNLPHLGLDNYPFLYISGWLTPGIPILSGPGQFDIDGNYSILWNVTIRTIGYFLEEDDNSAFNSPLVLYEGPDNSFDLRNKLEGTYFYRARAYNEIRIGHWSNILGVTVNHLPNIPKNLIGSTVPEGNALNLSWDLNQKDTVEYCVHWLNDSNWEYLATIAHPLNYFLDTGLIDGLLYSYKICAIDSHNQGSGFSEIVTGIPKDTIPPAAPIGLIANAISNTNIDLKWSMNNEIDLTGYLIYMKDNSKSKDAKFELNQTLNEKSNSTIISGLKERITYEFKIKAFDEVPNNSLFSEIAVATTPDLTPPSTPTGLKVSNPTNNSLRISWDPNPEPDVKGYYLYFNKSLTGSFKNPITNKLIIHTEYLHTNLEEGTRYFYKVSAVDDSNWESLLSDYVFNKTLIPPRKPQINNSISDFNLHEDTIDELSINLHYWFKDVNNNPLNFSYNGSKHINVTFFLENGTVILIPEKNWNGQETLIFTTFNIAGKISDDVIITVIPVNDKPGPVKIIKPKNGIKFNESETIDFEGQAYDPDLPYGDILTYKWYSNIDGELGQEKTLKSITLSAGEHVITLEVADSKGKKTEDQIDVEIVEKFIDKDSKSESKVNNNLTIMIIGLSLIIIVSIVIVIFIIKKKKMPPQETDKKTTELQPQSVKTKLPSETTIDTNLVKPIQIPVQQQQIPITNYYPPITTQLELQPQQNLCTTCGQQKTYMQQSNRYYCYQCQKYE